MNLCYLAQCLPGDSVLCNPVDDVAVNIMNIEMPEKKSYYFLKYLKIAMHMYVSSLSGIDFL